MQNKMHHQLPFSNLPSPFIIHHSALIIQKMTHIKICGITNLEDALAAIEAGADLLGFNFYPPSPRSIAPKKCAEITAILAKESPQITLVGVFVNMPVEQVQAILTGCCLHLAQLHGDESPEMLASLSGRAFKAIRLPASSSARASDSQQAAKNIDAFIAPRKGNSPTLLVDAAVKGVYGGSGMVADWSAAAKLAKRIPLLLAGGLTPENVAEAVQQVHPWAWMSPLAWKQAPE